MAVVPIISWNVRGLNNPLYRWSFPSYGNIYLLYVFFNRLISHWTCCHSWDIPGWAFHFTHTSYSRGVSVLVHHTLEFQVYKQVDTEGQYVILFCCIFLVKCILACVYIPPPFNSAVLRVILTYQLCNPEIPLFIVRDLNCYLDPSLDKHTPGVVLAI